MKAIKVKNKYRSCPYCKNYNQRDCKLTKTSIPQEIFIKGCKKYKKNKYLFF